MANGGARPGAGRKPRAEKYAAGINKAEKRIVDRLPQLIDHLFALAEGVQIEETTGDGESRVYRRPPCFKSASYLVDRILGRPAQAVEAEVSGPGGAPLNVAFRQALDTAYGDDSEPEPDA